MTGPVPGGLKVTFASDDKQVVLKRDGEGFPGDAREGDVKSDALVFPDDLAGGARLWGVRLAMGWLTELYLAGV